MLGAITISQSNLEPIIIQMSREYDVPVALVKATIQAESNWDPNASRYEAHLNDSSWGLMQVLLKTGRWILKNDKLTISELVKPEVNIRAGTAYLGYQLKRYNRSILDAIAAYNAGSAKKNTLGIYSNQMYVNRVYGLYLSYRGTELVTTTAGIPMLLGVGVVGLVAFYFQPEGKQDAS